MALPKQKVYNADGIFGKPNKNKKREDGQYYVANVIIYITH